MDRTATVSGTALPGAEGRTGRVGYPVPPGPSILEMMWGRMVAETLVLLDMAGWGNGDAQKARQIGRCTGMAEMIAVLLNPYNPNVDEVRAEVMRRIQNGDQA